MSGVAVHEKIGSREIALPEEQQQALFKMKVQGSCIDFVWASSASTQLGISGALILRDRHGEQ